MLVLGVTGGVGAGKSTVLDHMEEAWGAQILKADEAAHMLMRRGQHCYEKIVEKFGEEILDDTGEINRIAFGEVVFKNREKLEQLAEALKARLVPKDPTDDKSVILEIRAGVGGEEAALFAASLYRM